MATPSSSNTTDSGVGNDDPNLDDYAIANIKEADPMTCMFSLAKALVVNGTIRSCPGHLDLSSCRRSFSRFELFRIACSLIYLKTLTFFSRRPNGARPVPPPLSATHGEQLQLTMAGSPNNVADEAAMKRMAKLCVLASQLAYQEEEKIRNVTQTWGMNFVEFLDCWNEYLQSNTTQAFIFTDKSEDATMVFVAFRGTEALSLQDWATDFDFSYYTIPGLGRVHMGFFEALGFGTRKEITTLQQAKTNIIQRASGTRPDGLLASGLPNDDQKVFAYDAISKKVAELLTLNPRAKLYVTGHSLGGALAALFTAFRLFENNGEDERLGAVFTFGQPRVGDTAFANYMETVLSQTGHQAQIRKYFRVVFRTDVVPRLPRDDAIFQFKHVAPCHFYKSTNISEVRHEQPYKNLISIILQPTPHLSAIKELLQSLTQRITGRSPAQITVVPLSTRFLAVLVPGITGHSLVYYIDAVTNAPSSFHGQPT